MKDLEPVLNALTNYQAGFPLDAYEIATLSDWLKESEQHRKLFEELRSWTRYYLGNINVNPRESIQRRLIEMEMNES